MSAAERLSEKWTFGREAKLRGQMWNFEDSLSAKGFIYFITLPLIFFAIKPRVNMVKKAGGDLMANARVISKFHICPRSFASRPNVHFSDNPSAADIISRYTSRRKGFIY